MLGLTLGTVCWVFAYVMTVNLIRRYSALEMPVAYIIAALTWGVPAAGLLISPRTRQAGAGLLLGVAISFIAWAGVCTFVMPK